MLNESVQNEAVLNQAVQNQAVQNQAVQNQAVQNQAVQNQAVQSQAVQSQAVQNQAVQNQAVQNQAESRASGGVPSASVLNGTVKWFNNAKGWGFIRQDAGPDVFVHYSQIAGDGFRTLREGDVVRFELRDGPKGPLAERVFRVD